jgi:hypothetical protein
MAKTPFYDVQELTDIYSATENENIKTRSSIMATLWNCIKQAARKHRACVSFPIDKVIEDEVGVSDYLARELSSIGKFTSVLSIGHTKECEWSVPTCVYLLTVTWNRYDLKLDSQ